MRGIVNNWDDMEKIWHHTLHHELKVQPEDHPIIMTEASLTPKQNREALTKILFEKFNVPCLYVSSQEVCALYASGRTIGLVLDSGDGVTHAVPIYEGYQVPCATQKMPLAGKEITDYFRQILLEKGIELKNVHSHNEIVREVKENMCYVVSDFEQASKEAAESSACQKQYEMPDGSKVTLGAERFKCAEALFEPTIAHY